MNTAEDFGLVAGINDYKHQPYPQLLGAKRDAEDFLKWLKAPDGGNVPKENVDPYTKLSDINGSEPMLSHLLLLLKSLRDRAPKPKKRIGRRIYIFLSGHGVSPRGEIDEAGLVTVDAWEELYAFLPGKQSADQLTAVGRFDEILLFMDCCRVTHVLLDPFKIPIDEKEDPAAARNVKRFYAFATGFGSTAREREDGGVIRGIFSRILLDGLRNAPADENGRRTTTQLRKYLETEMGKISIDGEPLVPKFPASDEIVLAENLVPSLTTVDLTFGQPTAGIEVLDGGNGLAPVQPGDFTAAANGLHFTLPFGKGFVIRATDSPRMITMRTDKEKMNVKL
jgi:hypothetical protein